MLACIGFVNLVLAAFICAFVDTVKSIGFVPAKDVPYDALEAILAPVTPSTTGITWQCAAAPRATKAAAKAPKAAGRKPLVKAATAAVSAASGGPSDSSPTADEDSGIIGRITRKRVHTIVEEPVAKVAAGRSKKK